MPKLQTYCPVCTSNYKTQELSLADGKHIPVENRIHPPRPVETTGEFNLGDKKFVSFSCGHMTLLSLLQANEASLSVQSKDGKILYPFQVDTTKFMQQSGFRALLNLDMGLGKTPIVCAAFRTYPELLPAIIVCKSSLKAQWMQMLWNWGDKMSQMVETSNDLLLPEFFPVAIISFDILRRMEISDETRLKYKTVIIDETQNIKSPYTKRTQEVRKLCKDAPHTIGLSGTPIKNNGTEYFTILNILRSDLFPNYNKFCWNWVETYWQGSTLKYGGIKRYEQFHERTKDFIVRYTRDEVMPDLPKIFRKEQFCDLGAVVQAAHELELMKFQDAYFAGEFDGNKGYMHLRAYMSRMRHITGMAKIKPCLDYMEQFLLSTDRKIVVFCHHKDVMEMLRLGLESLRLGENGEVLFASPALYTADLDSTKRYEITENFSGHSDTMPEIRNSRILLASTLSIQEGVNLQPVSDCIMLEQQWNPANEDQALARFPRPGATADRIDATTFIAIGTIDEYFAELKERKRQICSSAVGDIAIEWDETSLMRELANILVTKGRKKWCL